MGESTVEAVKEGQVRTNESLCGEIESLRNDNRRVFEELQEAKKRIGALESERNRLNNWVDVLIKQLPKRSE
jgi:FtsZ-binding cell division protein ZapB